MDPLDVNVSLLCRETAIAMALDPESVPYMKWHTELLWVCRQDGQSEPGRQAIDESLARAGLNAAGLLTLVKLYTDKIGTDVSLATVMALDEAARNS
jgi:hypothetical protein